MTRNFLFYHLKPLIPKTVQIALRRVLTKHKRNKYRDVWPIDEQAVTPPKNWQGWPDGKQFALVLTHDVESAKGVEKCLALADLEESLGFRSSFNFVINDYHLPKKLRETLTSRGFEIGVHGYTHDGRYLQSENSFLKQCPKINEALKEWGAVGYRTPSMLGSVDWFHRLNIDYDASTFDTDPFEPIPIGARTIFPFWINDSATLNRFVELPYTLAQDSTLFIIMEEKSIDIWTKKLDWIAENGGMALLNVHPDYMKFPGTEITRYEYSPDLYGDFLNYLQKKYKDRYWNALPKEVAAFWKTQTC